VTHCWMRWENSVFHTRAMVLYVRSKYCAYRILSSGIASSFQAQVRRWRYWQYEEHCFHMYEISNHISVVGLSVNFFTLPFSMAESNAGSGCSTKENTVTTSSCG
jgi:hypothetical protein